MGASLHVNLPDEMRDFLDRIADGTPSNGTPSDYVRELIRKDMERMEVYGALLEGLDQAERGEFVPQEDVDALFAGYGVSED